MTIEIESANVTEVFTGSGEIGVRAEAVAERAVKRSARIHGREGARWGPYLADQLLVPLALAGGGAFRTMPLTRHSTTNIDVVRQFLNVEIAVARETPTHTLVEVRGAA